jgi:hypothetical protein
LNGEPEDPWKLQMCLVFARHIDERTLYFCHDLSDGPPCCWKSVAPL